MKEFVKLGLNLNITI